MKVLSFNLGYLLGFQSQREWLRRPHRLLLGDEPDAAAAVTSFVRLVTEERPDHIALQEVDLGSIRSRFTDQHQVIASRLREEGFRYDHRADVKYGPHGVVAGLPVLRNMSNAVFWTGGTARPRYLSSGLKRLVHVVSRPDAPTVVSVHLSKTRGTREAQLAEVASLVDDHDDVVVTGDFNVTDREEFETLTRRSDLTLHVPGDSYPTVRPTHAFDVFLVSEGLSVDRCEVLDHVTVSDHMPVIAEVR